MPRGIPKNKKDKQVIADAVIEQKKASKQPRNPIKKLKKARKKLRKFMEKKAKKQIKLENKVEKFSDAVSAATASN